MEKRRIVLCDDNQDRVKRWRQEIEAIPEVAEKFSVENLTPREFAQVFSALEQRQVRARRDASHPKNEDLNEIEDDATVLDGAEIVIVDFDLTPREVAELEDGELDPLVGAFGDVFAYLTRCYSTAGYTVLVNQTFFQPTFDLTMTEFIESFADLNISDSDLRRKELWLGVSDGQSFRPWHWPKLIDASKTLRSIESSVKLDEKVFEVLELDAETVMSVFDAVQLEPLGIGRDVEQIEQLTFKDLADARCAFGRRSRSEVLSAEQELRLAAGALNHWLEKVILPSQNVFVDAPHLAERRPNLVLKEPWKDLAAFEAQAVSAVLNVDAFPPLGGVVASFFSRPVWFWPDCPAPDLDIEATAFSKTDLVFCEDVSAFLPEEGASEFRSSVAGPWTQRYVSARLSGAQRDTDPNHSPIDYRPETRFF